MTRSLSGSFLVLVLVSSAAALSPLRPAARSILNLPAAPYRYQNVALPAHFSQHFSQHFSKRGRNLDNTPPDNPLSDDGATLGRVLFYDTRLSANDTTSCATCHVQAHAFADPKPFSDPNLGYVSPRPLKFTASEKAALVAFLKTLTDRASLTDARFSNPFVDTKDAALKSVKRAALTARAMLTTIGAAAVQAPVVLRSALLVLETPETPPLSLPPPAKSSHPTIERLASFDGNKDLRIARHELPERMQGLVARGDGNADAALDSNEIRDLVSAASFGHPVPLRHQPSEGLPGVIRDLKLPPPKRLDALAIVSAHKLSRNVNDPSGIALHAKIRAVLDDEEYGNFVAAAARLSRVRGPSNDHRAVAIR
jgi:hypothetical protein